ncbi:MAG: hypothetical protein ABI790_03165 [Betaproteobacteria bacterium]
MSEVGGKYRAGIQRGSGARQLTELIRTASSRLLCFMAIVMGAVPLTGHAENRTGTTSARAHIDFRIIVPAIIKVSAVTQPAQLAIDERHVAQGYVDLDAGTSVRLTSNSHAGYQMSAQYDSLLLSSIEVVVASQRLTVSAGYGSIRVAAGRIVDEVIPISYRLHLAPGVIAGHYRWPVALAFSLATA